MDRFSVDQSGMTTAQTSDGAVMTNVAVWTPSDETAFENARSATVFTRIGTRHPPDELKIVLDATPTVKQTFCLSVNNVLLIFSDNIESHRADADLDYEVGYHPPIHYQALGFLQDSHWWGLVPVLKT
ncbi:hypothetical protein TWF191_006210 [Orbilia oligospora]|uniref:Uncharacterized protein n=1 Tax=Orbilia oligospora TaxID=2813651 RepID=A0A7C8UZI9_ORBOL|nr:hypothetical protein TWF191_006210 [Orbilia oligospora]